MRNAKVTIAIPTLNRAEYLRLSIVSALAQTYGNLEVLISDNASTDHTAEVLASFAGDARLRRLYQPVKLTMVENWNACVAAAKGEYFLLLSDDDLLEPEAIAEMVAAYEHGPLPSEKVGMVYCRGRVIDEHGVERDLRPPSPSVEEAEQLILSFFNSERATYACTILFRRSDILDGYDAGLPLLTDAAQWVQAVIKHGCAVYVDRVLANYRVHLNISAMTPVAAWHKDTFALAEFAIARLQSAGLGSAATEKRIRRALRRINVRIIPGLLSQRSAGSKRDVLRAYWNHRQHFASVYGVWWILQGAAQVVGRRLRSLPGTLRPASVAARGKGLE